MDAARPLNQLDDRELIASLSELVGRCNRTTAEILRHLAEVERRELHLRAACSSMHVYCTEVLGFDDATAYNRIYVARLARRFPVVLELLAQGRIHLTGLRLLAPHLAEDNLAELLEAAGGKTKRQIEKLVAELAPKPDVPDRIRKRPLSRRPATSSTCSGTCSSRPDGGELPKPSEPTSNPEPPRSASARSGDAECSRADGPPAPPKPEPARERDKAEPRSAERFKVEFTASAGVVDRLERVQALMAHREPGCGYETVIEAGLELLEAKLLKERFGVGAKPREAKPERRSHKTTRHVPRAVRREVYERDGLRCAFVDPETGRRCGEAVVELQHHRAYARGGEHSAKNVSMHCKAHNAHAARKDFGQAHVEAAVQRRRAQRASDGARESAAPPRRPAAMARPTPAAQLGLFGS